eukprot:9288710-Alexandrium_andersonii.AAC.1
MLWGRRLEWCWARLAAFGAAPGGRGAPLAHCRAPGALRAPPRGPTASSWPPRGGKMSARWRERGGGE